MARSKKTVKKSQKNRKRTNTSKSKTYKKYRGGCNGCSVSSPIMAGNVYKGGNIDTNTFQVPISKVYPLNNEIANPNDPSVVISARNLQNMAGGKKSKLPKKMKGGNVFSSISDFLLGNTTNTNIVTSFGNSASAQNNTNILTSKTNINPAPNVQPISRLFHPANPPLV